MREVRIEHVEIRVPGRTGRARISTPPGEVTILYDEDDSLVAAFRAGIASLLCGSAWEDPRDGTDAGWLSGSLSLRSASGQLHLIEHRDTPGTGDVASAGDAALAVQIPADLYRALFVVSADDILSDERDRILEDWAALQIHIGNSDLFPGVSRYQTEQDALADRAHLSQTEQLLEPNEDETSSELTTLCEQLDELQASIDAVEGALDRIESGPGSQVDSRQPPATAHSAADCAIALRREIDEVRESWTRLGASSQMYAAHYRTGQNTGIPRRPWFLGALALGVSFPIAVGVLFDQPVVAALGIVSATLGGVTLFVDHLSRKRFQAAQLQAQYQLELILREAQTRFYEAAEVSQIARANVTDGIQKLEQVLDEIVAAESAGSIGADQDVSASGGAQDRDARQILTERRDNLQMSATQIEAQIKRTIKAWQGQERIIADLGRDGKVESATGIQRPAYLPFASDAFNAMTFGAFPQIISTQDEELAALGQDGRRIPLTELSADDRALARLALRLGLIHACRPRFGAPPVLVDDILSHLVPRNAVEALRALEGLSARQQVLLFTSNHLTVDLVQASDLEADDAERMDRKAFDPVPALSNSD